jgi:hypothetical protein
MEFPPYASNRPRGVQDELRPMLARLAFGLGRNGIGGWLNDWIDVPTMMSQRRLMVQGTS